LTALLEPQTNKYKILRVRIFNGRHLPTVEGKESCDPYVELLVRGHPQDEKIVKTQVESTSLSSSRMNFRSKMIYCISFAEGNSYCPEWDETFEFPLTQSHNAILIFGTFSTLIHISFFE
jgi:hypothetical protein